MTEAELARRFLGIAFRGEGSARRPWVIGTGLDIWEICQMVDESDSVPELVADTHLTDHDVRLALAYREICPEEIRQALDENRRPVGEWRRDYPLVQTLHGSDRRPR